MTLGLEILQEVVGVILQLPNIVSQIRKEKLRIRLRPAIRL